MASSYTYTGEDERTYPQYLDVTAPTNRSTLTAVPGGSYVIEPAAGHVLPDEDGVLRPVVLPVPPDDGRWTATKPPKQNEKKDA